MTRGAGLDRKTATKMVVSCVAIFTKLSRPFWGWSWIFIACHFTLSLCLSVYPTILSLAVNIRFREKNLPKSWPVLVVVFCNGVLSYYFKSLCVDWRLMSLLIYRLLRLFIVCILYSISFSVICVYRYVWFYCMLPSAAPYALRPLWVKRPGDLESDVRVTCDVGYLCANFGLPRPLCSRLSPDVRDRRQTDRRQAKASLIAPPIRAGHNK